MMDDKPMRLWSVVGVSHGKRYVAVVQETSLQNAIERFCKWFPNCASEMVNIEGRDLRLNRFDDFGKLQAGIAQVLN